jgi:geranylgeranyl pyrophosphate synthase
LIQTLKKCGVSQRQTITQLLNNTDIAGEEKIATIIDIYTQMEMPTVCTEAMEEYYAKAMTALDKVNKTDEEKTPFVEFAKKLMGRID